MMGNGVVEFVLYRGEKLFCNGAVHIIISAALGVNVCDLLIETALAGANIANAF